MICYNKAYQTFIIDYSTLMTFASQTYQIIIPDAMERETSLYMLKL